VTVASKPIPKPVGQETRQENRAADRQCQNTVEAGRADPAIARVQAVDDGIAGEPEDIILLGQAGGEVAIRSDIHQQQGLIGKQADRHPKENLAAADTRGRSRRSRQFQAGGRLTRQMPPNRM
jgi:hypothetical protein